MEFRKLSVLSAAALTSLLSAESAMTQTDQFGTLPPAPAANACPSLPMQPSWPTPNPLQFSADNVTVIVNTAPSLYAPSDVRDPVPTNLCQNVYSEVLARRTDNTAGPPMPNSLPSTPERPYNLHPDPTVETIDPRSPTDDLRRIFRAMRKAVKAGRTPNAADVQFAIDMFEGNALPREYSGFPLLHYNGAEKVVTVVPEYNDPADPTKVTGGNAEIHQIMFDGRIESNAMFVVPDTVLDVPWTITYKVSVLNRGREDFAPFAMYFNGPVMGPDGKLIPDIVKRPGIGIDQTFFPMEDGTRTTFKVGMGPARQYKLTYHWGWRRHPSRIQATENGLAKEMGVNLIDWERCVFGSNPTASEANKLAAIAMIGDLAPEKKMWKALRMIRANPSAATASVLDGIERAFDDWQDRNHLPSGVVRDDNYDVNVVYLNNTLYGDLKGYVNGAQRVIDFHKRGDMTRIKVMNGDYFERAHMLVDFGGTRGWENTFQSTIPQFGAGPWFTFGRAYWWPILEAPNGGPQPVPAAMPPAGVKARTIAECQARFAPPKAAATTTTAAATTTAAGFLASRQNGRDHGVPFELSMTPDSVHEAIERKGASALSVPTRDDQESEGAHGLGLRKFEVHWNYEPSQRLKLYMFDQLHHDVAIWSMH